MNIFTDDCSKDENKEKGAGNGPFKKDNSVGPG